MSRLIAFTGPMGCGKTVAAEYLVENGPGEGVVQSFADPLKKCVGDLFSFSHRQLYTLEGKNTIDDRYGVSPRLVLQRFGTEFVRTTVPTLWEILMEQKVRSTEAHYKIYVDDCRFEAESALIRRLGGTVVHITGRCLVASDHKSEAGVEVLDGDIVIDNSGTEEEFLNKILAIGAQLLERKSTVSTLSAPQSVEDYVEPATDKEEFNNYKINFIEGA